MNHVYSPDEGGTGQLLVYLHGHGGRPEELHPFLRDHHDDGIVRLCPQAPRPADEGFSWFDSGPRGVDPSSLRRSVDDLTAVIDTARTDLGLEWPQVVLGGFSQGAATAIAVAVALGSGHSARLSGLLLQAGFVPEVFDDDLDLTAISAASVLLQHGADDEVVPAFMAKDLAEALTAAASVDDVRVEIALGGHSLSPVMLDTARRWLGDR